MARAVTDGWIILRTSGPRTLKLAASLLVAGIEAWTPAHMVRSRNVRAKNRRVTAAPIMPTFVFVRQCHRADLAQVLAMPMNPHPAFSIFRHIEGIPVIADHTLTSLRAVEERAQRAVLREKRVTFLAGQTVKVERGPATGMSGVVRKSDDKFAFVAFGSIEMKIATFLLAEERVRSENIPSLAA